MAVHIHDGVGSVELLEVFGSDLTVVNAARVSFDKEVHEMKPADEKLIDYLVRNRHDSPMFHPILRFRIKMPLFIAREWYRHTVGLARNEVSRRYVDSEPEFFLPDGLRKRDKSVKQGSAAELVDENEELMQVLKDHHAGCASLYKMLLEKQVAPEQARCVLPVTMYTSFIETGSLAAYARICGLRLDPHAQKEIQEYAQLVHDACAKAFPVTWAAFQKHGLLGGE